MRSLILLTFLIFSSSIWSEGIVPKSSVRKLAYRHFPPPTSSYNELISKINSDRLSLKRNHISIDSCKLYLLHSFEHEVFPHWVGTTWDYNGYTNIPGEGKLVACGYFVSTPLKHMGFNWNRFKLAQMYSKKIAETLCEDVSLYSEKEVMLDAIEKRENNLYIVGLDNHVGMILKSHLGIWFVHSNYIGLKGPDKEIATESLALDASNNYYLGTFTSKKNIENWLNGTIYITE